MLGRNFGKHSGESEGGVLVVSRRFTRHVFLFEFCGALIELHFPTVSQVRKLLHIYKYQKPDSLASNRSMASPLVYAIVSII